MTDQMSGNAQPQQAPPTRWPAKAAAYARLSKLDIVDYYIGLALVCSLLAPALRFEPRTLAFLGAVLLAEIAVVAAMVSFDDVTGYRDGSDAANYGADAPRRRLARKPLVAGTLTEAEALRYGRAMTALAVALWAGVVVFAPHRPVWAAVVAAGCLVAAVQYSWGLKLSYRGFQEVFLIGLGIGWVLAPYGLLTGGVDGFVLVQAALFGFGPMLFGLYSNTNDIGGDRAAGRLTIAALAPPRGNAAFIIAMTAAESALITGSTLLGVAPWWFPAAMLPVFFLRAAQLLIGFWRGDILRARKLAIRTHRVTVALLIAANLAASLGGWG